MTTTTTAPRVYVGTYAKYTAGSLAGAWLDLDDFADAEDFSDACRQLHADEDDPEIMIQDREGCPSDWVQESNIAPQLWEWLDLDGDQREIVTLWLDEEGDNGTTIQDITDRYCGCIQGTFRDWCEENFGDLVEHEMPAHLLSYFDWSSYSSDCEHDYVTHCSGYPGYQLHVWTR